MPQSDTAKLLNGQAAPPRASTEEGGGPAALVGLDIGAETVKAVALRRGPGGRLSCAAKILIEHRKNPEAALRRILERLPTDARTLALATGRLSRAFRFARAPLRHAAAVRAGRLFPNRELTLISIGSRGFSVLELHSDGMEVYRENSRCSQGTGNFLRQLTERLGYGIEEAGRLCAEVEEPAPLSGRCPVILKTELTHLANRGESHERILAGLFDAVCANALALVKPGRSPREAALIGGLCRSPRIRRVLARRLEEMGMRLLKLPEEEALFWEAWGAALEAAEHGGPIPPLEAIRETALRAPLERVPPLREGLRRVRRIPPPEPPPLDAPGPLILGFDIGSTGSKLAALDARTEKLVWDAYCRTGGDPIRAARELWSRFLQTPAANRPLLAFGVTGSGREIVGSLLAACYERERVFILNEIVAHATGALSFDPNVDTIFEIGGQDAKYIRLESGRVVDAAMNEACSAGTGSFIEEQGALFEGRPGVRRLNELALRASWGVSLGQHCSVFMAEAIEEATAAGAPAESIIAGLYDSIIQNYLHRVKGNRSVGQVVFCQGMPFASDALAAAAARQSGARIIVPPNPGSIGALGIALLARRHLRIGGLSPADPRIFLEAKAEAKDTFICRAKSGCGGEGNRCRIDRLTVSIRGKRLRFLWGGACSLYDKGFQRHKLPDRAPDPFRERERLALEIAEQAPQEEGPVAALSDAFMLKALYPFFAVFLRRLGFRTLRTEGEDRELLERGLQIANVPYCAPMAHFHGVAARMQESGAELLFIPMIRSLPRTAGEKNAKTCPIAQAAPDLIARCLGAQGTGRLISPVIDFDRSGLRGESFRRACRALAAEAGAAVGRRNETETAFEQAFEEAVRAQERFESGCRTLGRKALEFALRRGIPAVVVLGRPYTIYNRLLNANVPGLLREQGALPIPMDCFPVSETAPRFEEMYWAYGRQILRAAHQIRRSPGVYALYCSNYSCGPDSFNLHFTAALMEGKPFAVIETDGHSGDAGVKTRIEAFLYCAREDMCRTQAKPAPSAAILQLQRYSFEEAAERDETLLIPRMGFASQTIAACFRGLGYRAETLPAPNAEALRLGRRHTSGKECLPMSVTLGTLLQRIRNARDDEEKLVFLMPRPEGPCRFGVYNLLNRLVIQRLGWEKRVRVWAPEEDAYFRVFPAGVTALLLAGLLASDHLENAFLEARAGAEDPEAVAAVHQRWRRELERLLERRAQERPGAAQAFRETLTGRLFGAAELLARAGAELAEARREPDRPRALIAGEIFVRLDPFSNLNLAEALEARGLRVQLAPFNEWLEYVDALDRRARAAGSLSERLSRWFRDRIRRLAWNAIAEPMKWPKAPDVEETLRCAAPYLRPEMEGEAVLTIGTPLAEFLAGRIDGAVVVGPLECMPNKIAEAQLHHLAREHSLPILPLSVQGDPLDPALLDHFAFEMLRRKKRAAANRPGVSPRAK